MVRPRFFSSGQYRTRTYDPCDVNAVLYQLSQLPVSSLFYRLLVWCQIAALSARAFAFVLPRWQNYNMLFRRVNRILVTRRARPVGRKQLRRRGSQV